MTEEKKAFLRGTVQILPLGDVKPNGWNPNVVPPHIMESIRSGFTTDGWLVSQALLVWGTDAAGTVRNLIIDGEHRHTAAVQAGLTEGPMVVVDGLTEAEAKALTIKMNQKRGEWDTTQLALLVDELQAVSDAPDFALDMGFSTEFLTTLTAMAEEVLDSTLSSRESTLAEEVGGAAAAQAGSIQGQAVTAKPLMAVRVVQMVYDDTEHAEFVALVKALDAEDRGVAQTVLKVLRKASAHA